MIKVTVEIVPFGKTEFTKELAELQIVNDGSGNQQLGNYKCMLIKSNGELHHFEFKNWNRDREVMEFVCSVLDRAREEGIIIV